MITASIQQFFFNSLENKKMFLVYFKLIKISATMLDHSQFEFENFDIFEINVLKNSRILIYIQIDAILDLTCHFWIRHFKLLQNLRSH